MRKFYYDDIDVGEVHDLGSFTAERKEQLEFAEQWHPELLPRDEEVSVDPLQNDIIANGLYIASSCMRLLVDRFLNDTASLGSFGLDEIRWPNSVKPGDTVDVKCRITEKTASKSHDDRGYIEIEVLGTNENDDEVIFWRGTSIFSRK
ncbi:MaoC/PaaZ C-terminal domain-containing protein [Haladaptatus salinisoli]|uniref:MaoC/PaaZ C-terminal domain-containing protein n=1 Tax=Haladaptatus salinisoli TaxID=2884876 RepID=UPI001D0B3E7F|nr:MaoC/PaaZ C-terminal domain-containing protein [Haladaptatus salinisoli]